MEKIEYLKSLSTFYRKGSIEFEQNLIKVNDPNVVMSVIPVGCKSDIIPVNQIASVSTGFNGNGKMLVGSLFLLLFASSANSVGFLYSLLLSLLGLSMIINAFHTVLSIKLTSGETKKAYFIIYNSNKAKLAEKTILNYISNRLSDTNVREQTDRNIEATNKQTDILVDAISKINK